MLIVVDDMEYVKNSKELLGKFMKTIQGTFDVKLFGELRTFNGWNIHRDPFRIHISQGRYIYELLTNYGPESCNGTHTSMLADVKVLPEQPTEEKLNMDYHGLLRQEVGELIYVGNCPTLDIKFAK